MLVHVRGFPRYAAAYNFYIFLGVTNLLLLLLLGDVAGVNTLRTADAHRADGTLVRHFHESPSSETTADLELLNDSETVMSFILGTSTWNRSYCSLEKRTLLSTLSRDFPLDHFFFLPLPPAMAAAIFCSFDFCWILGGCSKHETNAVMKEQTTKVRDERQKHSTGTRAQEGGGTRTEGGREPRRQQVHGILPLLSSRTSTAGSVRRKDQRALPTATTSRAARDIHGRRRPANPASPHPDIPRLELTRPRPIVRLAP